MRRAKTAAALTGVPNGMARVGNGRGDGNAVMVTRGSEW